MKNALSVLMIILFANASIAQNPDYNKSWKKVEQLEIEGLPASALKIVDEIYTLAKKDNNAPQLIKTMLFKSKFALVLQEDAQLKIIEDFKSKIEQSEFPTKNILESLLANLYWQYFNQNRYKFYRRTKTSEKVDATDFRTWDLQTLFNEIHVRYQNSLLNGLMLQQEDLSKYSILLNEQKDSKIYRPTLFDFLNHNALEFYKTNETHITKPDYKFEVNNSEFLSDFGVFSFAKINSKDSISLQLNALKIYQNLLRFHMPDASPYALVDVDIERLKFINQHATFDNKEGLLLETLKSSSENWKTNDVSGLYDFEIASIYYNQSKKYQFKTNEENRWKAKEAIAICDAVISKFPKSKGAEKCAVLKQQILQLSLQITTESYLPILKHSRLLVRYKNLDNLDFKIYKLNRNQLKKFNKIYRKEEQLAFIEKLKETTEWNSKLRNENDYQTHSTEIILPKLNNGNYLIFVSHNDDKTYAFNTIQVTNLALVESENEDFKTFQVIDRNKGKPIVNANLEVSYYKNFNERKIIENKVTNHFGKVSLPKFDSNYRELKIKVAFNNEKAFFGDYYIYDYYNQKKEKKKVTYKTFLFTDRSIYRPGQILYFKAIAMKTEDEKSEVISNESIFATLYDVNGQQISDLNFDTNEFGSISGEFILPNNGLNGEYYIEVSSVFLPIKENYFFSVEEYKRPKFETKFNPVTETFKVNDSVTIKGNALAYAGSNITDAKVVYRVHRKVEYPRWYYWYRPSFYSESQEITHGESITNDKGEFEITFKALPDESVDKSNLPVFNYEITADVTDLNGETRSATTIVNVGYHALLASINIDSRLDKTNKKNAITIDTKNLNGEFVPAKGTIKMYKLVAPKTALRQRPWSAPDYQDISKETFNNLFPHDAYNDEHNSNNWEKGELVFVSSFNTENSKTLNLGKIKKWQSGEYLITLESKDKFGQIVKDEIKTNLFSDADKTLADNQLFSISHAKNQYNVGDNVVLNLASATHLFVTIDIEKGKKIVNSYIVELNNNKKELTIPVEEKDLGGFAIRSSFSAFNSFQSAITPISVPYPKTNLDIETTTFRDKLQPGTDETWSFKIKGPKGDKVSAELLASMYDASLDQFKSHTWNFNPINNPTYYSYNNSNAKQSFGTKNFRVQQDRARISYPQQYYDQLNWYGFNFNNNRWAYQNYINRLRTKRATEYHNSIKEGYISGTIFDENGLPLPGVNVVVKGTINGVSTDFDGNFTIEATKNDELVISYLGFNTQSLNVNNKKRLNISLTEDSAQLDEVVVVAYGTVEKQSVTGAISIVESESVENLLMVSGVATLNDRNALYIIDGVPVSEDKFKSLNPDEIQNVGVLKDASATAIYGSRAANGVVIITTKKALNELNQIKVRKNLQETAFFFPQLKTDSEGNVNFSFTTPEALTQWKLQLLAHTKTLENATKTLTTVTQKELMVIPNAPRFLREGDNITISTKIANLTDKQLSGQAVLILTDAISGKDISEKLLSSSPSGKLDGDFTVPAKGNTQVSWNLSISDDVQAIQYKVIAKAGDFSDGEQNALPVLSNRMLVTETLPMWIRSNETKTFTLDKLKTNTSTTLKHHKLTLEMTSNPAWYAVQALPYLMEYPYECNEQTFSRYYANALASHIANSNPRIQEVFNQWKNTDALLSNLEKNEALKSILIQETPWLRDAHSETEQKKRIALLFDLNKMNNELQSAINKLKQNQIGSGAWAWFNGGRENRYITQHIITGFGHLKQLNVISTKQSDEKSHNQMIQKAINYLDNEFIDEYNNLTKYNKDTDLTKDHLSYTQLHYLYMRSFFNDIKKSKKVEEITTYYHSQIKKYWLKRSLYAKGLMALVVDRMDDKKTSSKILKSLKENSITSDELGMYWKANTNSWYWYQAPIETQALLIEAFAEIENNAETIDNLKIWLLKNKQTNKWKTTKATTEAVYALLLQGSDWLSVTEMVDVVIGGQQIEASKLENVKVEAGTGYYKTSWNTNEITPKMANVKLTKKGNGIAWGSLYWQYFEDLDKITSAETPLKLKKKLFLKTNTDLGEEISEITENTNLKVGDLVRVRIELRSDRNMEFIHMKDMRASGLEPVNVISQYKWQDGLGYYESTKDASTNFFFDYLPKGVYVFEYDLRVNNAGNMSNGITTIQSMYAPEFSSHSESIRLLVK